MKKYILIRIYPGSPKLGSIIQNTNPVNDAKDCWFHKDWCKPNICSFILPKSTNPENNPEFWEEIIEKDYEILSFINVNNKIYSLQEYGNYFNSELKYNSYEYCLRMLKIHSVKRLSDNEIFTIDDKCHINGNGYRCPIIKIELTKNGETGHLEKYRNKETIKITLETKMLETSNSRPWGPFEFDCVSKSKIPLFTTEDGVGIYLGDESWILHKNTWILSNIPTVHNNPNWMQIGESAHWEFSTKKAAQTYIDINKPKPLFTSEDGVDIFEGNTIYGINTEWEIFSHFTNLENKIKNWGIKPIFSTKEKAEQYILMNKPCLSLNDISKSWILRDVRIYRKATEEKLKELVKSKL